MDGGTIYLETGSTDPRYNLAFEEYVLRHRREGSYLILWQNDNAIIIGQNQNAEEEINRAFAEAQGIAVVRRSTGGGAVYHDLGNLNYSFITDAGKYETMTMERFTMPVTKALQKLGLRAEASGRNDILVEGLKVSGTAQRLERDRILHHGTLLFDSDLEKVAGALNADPEKFKSKAIPSIRSRVGNIRSFLTMDMTLQEFWAFLIAELSDGSFVRERLTEEELKEVLSLRDQKYSTWEWNFGRSPKSDLRKKVRLPAGTLEVCARIAGGIIQEIRFYGDFLSVLSAAELERALAGAPFRREDVRAVLDAFPLQSIFGGITEEEILETIFG